MDLMLRSESDLILLKSADESLICGSQTLGSPGGFAGEDAQLPGGRVTTLHAHTHTPAAFDNTR